MLEPKRFNFFDPAFANDPFPVYAEMRKNAPVAVFEPLGFWTVSRYADVAMVLKTPQLFSSAGFRPAFEPPWVGVNPGARSMLVMDPPDHTKLRVLVSRAFGPSFLKRAEAGLRARVEKLADDMAARDEIEVASEIAVPITAGVLGDVLGLDASLHGSFKRWSDDLASITPTPQSPEHEARVKQSIAEITQYVASTIAARRASPGNDLVSDLCRADVDGEHLSDDELVAFLFLLLVAGLETTVNLVAKSAILLAQRDDVMTKLRAEPALVPSFVEEMLRYDPPTHGLFRVTVADTEIAGMPIRAGTPLMVLLASANRDEASCPNAEAFELGRQTSGGVAFGHGPHFCVGAGLARLEAKLMLEAMVRRFTRLELRGPIAWNHTLTVRAPAAVPIKAHRA
ncbi:MAG: cytochrome P450 [Polyangiaceae bacterium]|nr:cytochrome P450 [Polyangiaceae bacterium]